ncbi:hypothetical protein EDB83DRAFT_2474579, partial [Lactarius deliciosus]
MTKFLLPLPFPATVRAAPPSLTQCTFYEPACCTISQQLQSVQEIRQSTGSTHDTICSDAMCIGCSMDGSTAR